MKGKLYLDFLEKWELINDKPLDLAVELFEKDIFEGFLNDWSNLHRDSLQNDEIWVDKAGLPIIPTSGLYHPNPDLIANAALYNDRQIIQDPIDRALEITGANPIEHMSRFATFLKHNLQIVIDLQPLFRENLIEIMPYQFIVSKFSKELWTQLEIDWFENTSLKYIENRMLWKVYPESNLLTFRVGDLKILLFERYGIIDDTTMKETKNGYSFGIRYPSNLKEVGKNDIEKWAHEQLHKHSSQIANLINEKILLAEIFSGSVATNEILTYEFIRRKNEYLTKKTEEPIISIHSIPILGKINLEKFIDFRANELPSFISFREEWNEGRGILRGENLSKNWIENLNQELDKCKKELNKSKKMLFERITEDAGWAGLGIGVGVLGGALLRAAVLTGMVPLMKDIKNAWADYLQDRSKIEASTPFFLLNVIEERSNTFRRDIPRDLPEKMTLPKEAIQSTLQTLDGAPIIFYKLPQNKTIKLESTNSKNDNQEM